MAVQQLEVRQVPSFLGQDSEEEVEVAVDSAVASAEEVEAEVSSVVVAAEEEEVVVEVPEGPTIRVASADRVGNSDYRIGVSTHHSARRLLPITEVE
jgi:hypothetical protein